MASLLAGKIAVVTGGGSGIGKAICQKLARHGARVVVQDLNDNSTSATIKTLDGKDHISFAGDVSKVDSMDRLKDVLKNLGETPSILVNCAGITKDSTLLKMSKEQWDAVLNVNLTGVFLMSQTIAAAAVAEKKPLSIINVSSIVGKSGNFGQTNYAATKAGVIGFTKSAAKELAKKNVRVNAVLPGFIKTPMTEAMPPNVLAEICKSIPMGRMGESEEIADSVLFLASDLSSYVTGTTIEVTGGYNM